MAESVIQISHLVLSIVVIAETIKFLKDSDVPMEVPTFGLPEEWADPLVTISMILGALYAQQALYWKIYKHYGRPNG